MPKPKWYQAGLSFECTQCGNCCSGAPGYVWATKEEIRRISEFLGRTDGWLDAEHLRRVGFRYSLTEKRNGDCIFLKREGGKTMCSIYPVRPLQCRTWPFWNHNLRSPDAWNEAHTTCPGMNRGEHHDLVQIETIRTKKKWWSDTDDQ
ncbi:MAG: YkgJ family cysteine cluster protein [Phycisphaerae bacterium]|jgi:Fe-S-cluster containining protein